jgi:hypothetical protein
MMARWNRGYGARGVGGCGAKAERHDPCNLDLQKDYLCSWCLSSLLSLV